VGIKAKLADLANVSFAGGIETPTLGLSTMHSRSLTSLCQMQIGEPLRESRETGLSHLPLQYGWGSFDYLRDEGVGFDSSAVPDPTEPQRLLLPGGRGLHLIRTLMDEVTFEANGTVVRMRKRLKTPMG
jgi:hypothetical protein